MSQQPRRFKKQYIKDIYSTTAIFLKRSALVQFCFKVFTKLKIGILLGYPILSLKIQGYFKLQVN